MAEDCSDRTPYLQDAKRSGHDGNRYGAHAHRLSKLSIEAYAAKQARRYERYKRRRAAVAQALDTLLSEESPPHKNGALDEAWFARRVRQIHRVEEAVRGLREVAHELALGLVTTEEESR